MANSECMFHFLCIGNILLFLPFCARYEWLNTAEQFWPLYYVDVKISVKWIFQLWFQLCIFCFVTSTFQVLSQICSSSKIFSCNNFIQLISYNIRVCNRVRSFLVKTLQSFLTAPLPQEIMSKSPVPAHLYYCRQQNVFNNAFAISLAQVTLH